MIVDAALNAFGGGSIITAVLTIFIKLWDRKREDEDRKTLLMAERSKLDMMQMKAVAENTNNVWGNSSRIIMLLTTEFVFLFALVGGYFNPDAVIWVGQPVEKDSFSLFGLIEYKWGDSIEWREFSGIVLLPIFMAKMGALMSYYLVGGMWSRR